MRNNPIFQFCLFISLTVFLSLPLSAIEKGQVKAKNLKGTVTYVIGESEDFTDLAEDQVFSDNSTVNNGRDSSVTLLFSNGSTIRLTRGTVFKVREFTQEPYDKSQGEFDSLEADPSNSTTDLFLQRGRLLFNVKKLSDKSSYEIYTPAGSAGIRGTEGEVSYYDDPSNRKYEMCVILSSGKVKLDSDLDPRIAQIQLQDEKAVCFSGDLDDSGKPSNVQKINGPVIVSPAGPPVNGPPTDNNNTVVSGP